MIPHATGSYSRVVRPSGIHYEGLTDKFYRADLDDRSGRGVLRPELIVVPEQRSNVLSRLELLTPGPPEFHDREGPRSADPNRLPVAAELPDQ